MAAIIGASFGAIAARLTAYLAMRDDVTAIRRNITEGLLIADAIEGYPVSGAAPAVDDLVGTADASAQGRPSIGHEPERSTADSYHSDPPAEHYRS